jgi:hypothetical protein
MMIDKIQQNSDLSRIVHDILKISNAKKPARGFMTQYLKATSNSP